MRSLLTSCVREYTWIHTTIGLLGNICFIIGSVLFLSHEQYLGTLFFIAGSSGMLIGNMGNAVVMSVEKRWREEREARERHERQAQRAPRAPETRTAAETTS